MKKSQKIACGILAAAAGAVVLLPFPRRIGQSYEGVAVSSEFPVSEGNDETWNFSIKGWYFDFLVFPDIFDGKLTLEDGTEYMAATQYGRGSVSKWDKYYGLNLERDEETNDIGREFIYIGMISSDWKRAEIISIYP